MCQLNYPPTKRLLTEWYCHFKDQKSAEAVKEQLSDLSKKIDHTLQPVFRSRKIGEDRNL